MTASLSHADLAARLSALARLAPTESPVVSMYLDTRATRDTDRTRPGGGDRGEDVVQGLRQRDPGRAHLRGVPSGDPRRSARPQAAHGARRALDDDPSGSWDLGLPRL